MRYVSILVAILVALVVGLVANLAASKDENAVVAKTGEQTTVVSTAFRASKLIGMEVKNTRDEKVGSISDMVVDTPTGHVRYAALSVGGFLGIGDKLFAVPWKSMVLKHDSTGAFFVLDVSKDKLRNAPGFDEKHWPDFGNPKFGTEIDKYYGVNHDNAVSATQSVNK